jgi:hypothetical protein
MEKVTVVKSESSEKRHKLLADNIINVLGVENIPKGFKIKEIQIDIFKGETRIIISDEL